MKTSAAVRLLDIDNNQIVRTNLCAYLELEHLTNSIVVDRPGLDALALSAARCLVVELQPALDRCGDRDMFSRELFLRVTSIMLEEMTSSTRKLQLFTSAPVHALFQLIAYAAFDGTSALLEELVVNIAQNALEFVCMPVSITEWIEVSVKCSGLPWLDLVKAVPEVDWRPSVPTWIAVTAMLSGNGSAFELVTKGRFRTVLDKGLLLELCNNDLALKVVLDCLKKPVAAAGNIRPILDWISTNAPGSLE
ncbi:hypothetical protein H9P43_006466 [Blastocladiella emersonii ATCC 22665]|nr:hypothetical protein H9P43_006466 [Blastocladiella emersonii ATCC 22665]